MGPPPAAGAAIRDLALAQVLDHSTGATSLEAKGYTADEQLVGWIITAQ